ncbi:TPA: hypothetical protein N0F65_005184 [Lagenidium giganteum]|uniref:Uncharacterized protein n=1 Tax=Lagenidium giganteum TaxID=4803 RepID=A0AAV2YZT7_9STRA|nr:TPA: hypothetical protein N0F65_005184 [Lagenidium giganteum]
MTRLKTPLLQSDNKSVASHPPTDTSRRCTDVIASLDAMAGVVYDVGSWRLGDDGSIYRRGKLKFSNGDIYDGEWVNGKRHGQGVLKFANGSSYAGQFEDNFYHGFGLLTLVRTQHPLTKSWRPGEKYEGHFARGTKHGKGTQKSASGESYDGEFVDGYYHGRGTCAYPDGRVYEGEWVHGRWNGRGELRLKDGSTYTGAVRNNLYHGFGELRYGSHAKYGSYVGDFAYGRRHGKGVRVFGDGKRYEGDWVDDEMHGVGVMETKSFKYIGEISRGLFHGHGAMSFANGDSYEGEFARSHYKGRGRFEYRDGGYYNGDFVASQRHGHGVRVFSNGDSYDGTWDADRMHGRGVYQRRLELPSGTATMIYDGDYNLGFQTGQASISYAFMPADQSAQYEWKVEYEFPEGSGCWHCGRGASTYKGSVLRGIFHGHGELLSPDGKAWRGEWVQGKLHGHGERVYLPLAVETIIDLQQRPPGPEIREEQHQLGLYRIARYEGEFVHNSRHGAGKMLFENGDMLTGNFVEGFAHGVVKYRFLLGSDRFAKYSHGQRVRWLDEDEEQQLREQEKLAEDKQQHEHGQRQNVLKALLF